MKRKKGKRKHELQLDNIGIKVRRQCEPLALLMGSTFLMTPTITIVKLKLKSYILIYQ